MPGMPSGGEKLVNLQFLSPAYLKAHPDFAMGIAAAASSGNLSAEVNKYLASNPLKVILL